VAHIVIVALGLVFSVLVGECNVGNIGDYVNTYKVTVTNGADADAFVTILMPDSKGTVLAKAGQAVSESGFEDGSVTIYVTPYDLGQFAGLAQLRVDLITKSKNPKLTTAEVADLWARINDVENRMSASHVQGQPGSGHCTAALSTKKPVAAVAKLEANVWQVDC
jgi:hypothetical protein